MSSFQGVSASRETATGSNVDGDNVVIGGIWPHRCDFEFRADAGGGTAIATTATVVSHITCFNIAPCTSSLHQFSSPGGPSSLSHDGSLV